MEVMLPCGYLTSVLGVISHSPDSLMVTSSVVGPSILASVMPCGWRTGRWGRATCQGSPGTGSPRGSEDTYHQRHAVVDQRGQGIEAGCVLPHVERRPVRQGKRQPLSLSGVTPPGITPGVPSAILGL